MRKGFTLIEVLIVLLILPVILTLSIGVLSLFSNELIQDNEQFEIFKLQYEYLMQTVANIQFDEIGVMYTYDEKEFRLIHDRDRFVKTPGYEILLYDVYELGYYEDCLSIQYKEIWYCLEI